MESKKNLYLFYNVICFCLCLTIMVYEHGGNRWRFCSWGSMMRVCSQTTQKWGSPKYIFKLSTALDPRELDKRVDVCTWSMLHCSAPTKCIKAAWSTASDLSSRHVFCFQVFFFNVTLAVLSHFKTFCCFKYRSYERILRQSSTGYCCPLT